MPCEVVLDHITERIGVLSTQLAYIRTITDSSPPHGQDFDDALNVIATELDFLLLLLVSLVPTSDH